MWRNHGQLTLYPDHPTIARLNPTHAKTFHPLPAHESIALWALVAVFFISSIAVLPLLSRYRPDERFYQDAAVQMVQSGDWLTPRYYDASLRFRKPILPYFTILGGVSLFGMNVFAARLGYLLAACGVLAMTYALSRRLFVRRDVALLSCAVLLSTIEFLNTSIRTTPDMLQALFTTLALYGLTGLLLRGKRNAGEYLAFYGGVGLVIATKGGLGLLLLVLAVVMTAWRGRRLDMRWRDLVHGPAMLLGVLLAGWWYVAAYVQHGDYMLQQFWGDQVGDQVARSWLTIPQNIVVYALSLITKFLPWPVLVAVLGWHQRRAWRAFYRRHREVLWFTGVWVLILISVFMFSSLQRTRYLLPAYPLVSGVYAAMLMRFGSLAFRRLKAKANEPDPTPNASVVQAVMHLIMLGVAGFGLFQIGLGAAVGSALLLLGGMVFVVIGLGGFLLARKSAPLGQFILLAVVILLAYRANDLFARQALYRSPAPVIAQTIDQYVDRPAVIAVARNKGEDDDGLRFGPEFASQVFFMSGGNVRLELFDNPAALQREFDQTPDRFDAVLFPANAPSGETEKQPWVWHPAGTYRDALKPADQWRWVQTQLGWTEASPTWQRDYVLGVPAGEKE